MNWSEIKALALDNLATKNLPPLYAQRLVFEFEEIEKQGSEAYWIGLHTAGKKFDSNPNSLLIAWLLGLVDLDPLPTRKTPMLNSARMSKIKEYHTEHGVFPDDFVKDADMPDIDIDCLPSARDPLKEHAILLYGKGSRGDADHKYGAVCSVGTWTTYKFKSALTDAAIAMLSFSTPEEIEADPLAAARRNRMMIEEYTVEMPDDVDELREGGTSTCKNRRVINGEERDCGTVHGELLCPACQSADTDTPTFKKLLGEIPKLNELNSKKPNVVHVAMNLIGRVKNMGMHAGAIIITDRELYGNIPLAKSGRKGFWTSMWTEGRNAQLSKMGYVKWDMLGLKTLQYIKRACELIETNRGISFGYNLEGWDDIDPTQNRAGHFFDQHGTKHYIELNDPGAIGLANRSQTTGIFQFDTDLAMSILANGVKTFNDLMFLSALGHPGPMSCVWERSPVNTNVGLVEIRNLYPTTHKIEYLTKNNEIKSTNDYMVVKSGPKKLYKITTESGKTLIVSADHKVLTDVGYKRTGDLQIEDQVCIKTNR